MEIDKEWELWHNHCLLKFQGFKKDFGMGDIGGWRWLDEYCGIDILVTFSEMEVGEFKRIILEMKAYRENRVRSGD